jgi:hypothetical protein
MKPSFLMDSKCFSYNESQLLRTVLLSTIFLTKASALKKCKRTTWQLTYPNNARISPACGMLYFNHMFSKSAPYNGKPGSSLYC